MELLNTLQVYIMEFVHVVGVLVVGNTNNLDHTLRVDQKKKERRERKSLCSKCPAMLVNAMVAHTNLDQMWDLSPTRIVANVLHKACICVILN